ncbi:hypothetical protein H920_11725 [Fukomys damarensis]|uniref:Uncharacterized protein n=1 Tax=Fukomys damarensis TaxID=885580 RepID=A0A091D8T1_FUKDA|nr:hypothetical protein H920_11725 [Fukomys damarensis]
MQESPQLKPWTPETFAAGEVPSFKAMSKIPRADQANNFSSAYAKRKDYIKPQETQETDGRPTAIAVLREINKPFYLREL